MSLAIVRFYVGQDMEKSIVNLYNKLMSNYDKIPPGVSQPLVKPRSIDDVPILSFTLWSATYGGYELSRVALEVGDELKKDQDVAEFHVIGGQKRQVRITLDPLRLRAFHLTSESDRRGLCRRPIFFCPFGPFSIGNQEFLVETGGFLEKHEEVGDLVVERGRRKTCLSEGCGAYHRRTRRASQLRVHGLRSGIEKGPAAVLEAVTISIAKKKGTNATQIAETGPGKN